MQNKLYFSIVLCVVIAVFFSFTGIYFSERMAGAAPHPAQQEKLKWFYQQSIFTPLAIPANPVPQIVSRFMPISLHILLKVLFFAQITLLVRRIIIWLRVRSIQPPSSFNLGWKVVLGTSFALWLIGILATLLPRLIFPLLGSEFAGDLNFAYSLGIAFILPYLWIISGNLFGPSFFVLEFLSLRKEGVIPLPNQSLQRDADL